MYTSAVPDSFTGRVKWRARKIPNSRFVYVQCNDVYTVKLAVHCAVKLSV